MLIHSGKYIFRWLSDTLLNNLFYTANVETNVAQNSEMPKRVTLVLNIIQTSTAPYLITSLSSLKPAWSRSSYMILVEIAVSLLQRIKGLKL